MRLRLLMSYSTCGWTVFNSENDDKNPDLSAVMKVAISFRVSFSCPNESFYLDIVYASLIKMLVISALVRSELMLKRGSSI
jgi:hypothetical protein